MRLSNINYKYWYLDDNGVLRPIDNKNIETTGTVDGSNIIDGVGTNKLTVADTEPAGPVAGDLWLDTSPQTEIDFGDLDLTTTGTVDGSNIITGVGINKFTVGTVEPTSPATGDVWLDTS